MHLLQTLLILKPLSTKNLINSYKNLVAGLLIIEVSIFKSWGLNREYF
jgi:hypothetical protein